MRKTISSAVLILPAVAALALAGCQAEEDTTYEAGVEDESGGELIVAPEDPNAVPVDLPETPMTPVPPEGEASEAAPADAPAE